MKSLKSGLIYWGWILERLMFSLVAGVMAYAIVMALMQGGVSDLDNVASMLPSYICMLICISAFMNALTAANLHIPLTISLGSTRRGSFIAMQVMQHLIMVEYVALGVVALYFLQRDILQVLSDYIFAIAGAVLLLLALANVACMVSVRFGKMAGTITYILLFVSILVCILVGVVSGVLEDGGTLGFMAAFAGKPYLFILGLVLDGIVIGIFYKAFQKSDLQF